jgi:hypothetical protein
MTPYEAIEAYLGKPEDYTFNIEDYTGRYGGLINVIGLRHRGLVVSGFSLYNAIQEHFGIELNRWEFMHELVKWCEAYTKSDIEVLNIGVNPIVHGSLQVGNSRYFCIPAERNIRSGLH